MGQPTTFQKEYPEVETCIVSVKHAGHGVEDWQKDFVSKHEKPGEYINCRNPICVHGGLEIGFVIFDMVKNRITEKTGSDLCRGSEGGVAQGSEDLWQMP